MASGQSRDRLGIKASDNGTNQPKSSTKKRVVVESRFMKPTISQLNKGRQPMPASSANAANPTSVVKSQGSEEPGIRKSSGRLLRGALFHEEQNAKFSKEPDTNAKKPSLPSAAKKSIKSLAVVFNGDKANRVLRARYWRAMCKLVDQRQQFQEEQEQLIADTEAIMKRRAEVLTITNEYENLSHEILRLRSMLETVDIQMPALQQLVEKAPVLQTKLERFTVALNQSLACIMTVDTKSVNMPATDEEINCLSASMNAVNKDLMQLVQTLDSSTKTKVENRDSIAETIRNLLKAIELLSAAFSAIKENKTLLQMVEEKKTAEEFAITSLGQLKRENSIRHPYN